MRPVKKTRPGTAAALAMAAATLAAGCGASGAPAAQPRAAQPAAAISSIGSAKSSPIPPVFAASFQPTTAGGPGGRLAVLSSRTGDVLRWLTPRLGGVTDGVLSVRDGWVYFVRYPAGSGSPAIWRMRLAGGQAQLVQAGASDYALSQDGHTVAYVIRADHGNVVELATRNLVTGKRNTIIMATRPSPDANNWPPGVSGLTWAPDDVHLAVQVQPTAALSSVLVFGAFTATAIRDGRTAPAPCAVDGSFQCTEFDPAYLASGALTYVVQRLSGSGTGRASLVAWQAGHRTTLLSLPPGMDTPLYDMTARGAAIWVSGPARPKGPWLIWRWSGGAPARVVTLPPLGASPYYGVGSIAW